MDKKMKNCQIKTCEMHTCGSTVRIIESVEPPIQYPDKSTVLEKKQFFADNYDFIRKMTIFEPRGHRDMFGVILTDPNEDGIADFGLLFFYSEGYLEMCVHMTIAVGRYLLEKGKIAPKIPETEVILDCPCGVIKLSIEWDGHRVGNTKLLNVPAFVQSLDYEIYVPELKMSVICDIAFGGNFFVIVSDKKLGVDFKCDSVPKIVDSAVFLLKTLKENVKVHHPNEKSMQNLCGVMVTDYNENMDIVKVLNVFSEKTFDRNPCGSGTTALLATQYFKGNLKLHQKKYTRTPLFDESIYFQGIPIEEVSLTKDIPGVRIEITARAFFTGETLMTYEDDDVLKFGFLL